ncbi:hypothetical protein [Streptomyces sp. NBC_00670]|uniref:hypothetical protein n=1 Tax=Streptomyces sp. NBC_00670 TaxID=2975804 RepID=UPI002E32240C|nr:hypothetical protein [Streptomyces sp. NBC_00670]
MVTLTPPEPHQPTPTPAPGLPVPSGPACVLCGTAAVVHWQRRPTDDELAAHHDLLQQRHARARALADPQHALPEPPPLPGSQELTQTVYACGPHAITLDAAARIHLSSCTAPNEADLPGCDCTPEPLPPIEELPGEQPQQLPEHWVPGGQ